VRVLWLSAVNDLVGAELGSVEAVNALSDLGHEVHVALPQEGRLAARLGAAASVHICWHNFWLSFGRRPPLRHRLRRSAYDAVVARRELARIVQETDAEVVVSNTLSVWAGALAARRARRPHVWFLHEFGREDHDMRFHYGSRASLAFMRRNARLFLVNSSALHTHWARSFGDAKLRHVRYAVEVPPQPSTRSTAGGPLRLVLAGARKRSKGQQDAVAAVNQLVAEGLDVELDLIGAQVDAGFDEALRASASKRALDRIRFMDFQEDPFQLVADADVSIMCSRSEALGRVTIEAMKLGKPVVGAAAGATPELIRHGWNGFLYEPGNAADLARWIKSLCRDPQAAREMGDRGKAWANEAFNREVYGADLDAALTTAVDPFINGRYA
jgi:glycosyltransferase involved in cell wall biosynthesis